MLECAATCALDVFPGCVSGRRAGGGLSPSGLPQEGEEAAAGGGPGARRLLSHEPAAEHQTTEFDGQTPASGSNGPASVDVHAPASEPPSPQVARGTAGFPRAGESGVAGEPVLDGPASGEKGSKGAWSLREACAAYAATLKRALVRVGTGAVVGTGPTADGAQVRVTCAAGFAFGTEGWEARPWSTDPAAPTSVLSSCSSGAWSSVPTCNRTCAVPAAWPPRTLPLFVGETILDFQCMKGYRPVPPGAGYPSVSVDNRRPAVTCLASGVADYVCTKISCGPFVAGPPGVVTVTSLSLSLSLSPSLPPSLPPSRVS